jgi:hypothetical protein
MNVLTDGLDDPLKPLGTIAGVLLVLAAVGTILGAPWATQATLASALIRVLGALLMGLLGAGLAYLSWTE